MRCKRRSKTEFTLKARTIGSVASKTASKYSQHKLRINCLYSRIGRVQEIHTNSLKLGLSSSTLALYRESPVSLRILLAILVIITALRVSDMMIGTKKK